MRIIVLNGPPGCGKDTIANILQSWIDCCHVVSFKSAMFDVIRAIIPFYEDDFFDRYDDRDLKEVPWDKLGGLSCREFMIRISEQWMKPLFGKNIFGKHLVKELEGWAKEEDTIVVSDSGFQEEFKCLQDAFGKENVHLVRMYRDGFDFEGDSRNYIDPEGSHFVSLSLTEGCAETDATTIRRRCS